MNTPQRRSRSTALAAGTVLVLAATACQPDLPASVVEGSKVSVAWDGTLTSTNTATRSGATAGNLDVSALTRSQFGTVDEDTVQVDEGFGTAKVVDQDPFTVRYDLAEPTWSDGIPLDAADLLLAWAAQSGFEATSGGGAGAGQDGTWFSSVPSGLRRSFEFPEVHESDRWIEVSFSEPVVDWRTALDVAVPAHVVAQRALGLEDPMEAKLALTTAIQDADVAALEDIAEVWNGGFALPEEGNIAPELLLSSGPYRAAEVVRSESGEQRVELVVNREYVGDVRAEFERIDLVQMAEGRRLAALGDEVDVIEVAPTARNRAPIRELERRDLGVATGHDGTMWALVLRADRGVFVGEAARTAFLRALPTSDLREAGAGAWKSAYESTDALLFAPGNESYQIALEDSGFRTRLKGSTSRASEERDAVGVPRGTGVCVLYDKASAFASGVFAGIRSGMAETGWVIRDCGEKGLRDVSGRADWHAALLPLPVPQAPADIAAQWGSGGQFNLSGSTNPRRDVLIQQLARTANPYDARDLRVEIEKSLVGDALALPIAMNPRVVVSDRDVTGVRPRPGSVAPLTSRAVDWGLPRD